MGIGDRNSEDLFVGVRFEGFSVAQRPCSANDGGERPFGTDRSVNRNCRIWGFHLGAVK